MGSKIYLSVTKTEQFFIQIVRTNKADILSLYRTIVSLDTPGPYIKQCSLIENRYISRGIRLRIENTIICIIQTIKFCKKAFDSVIWDYMFKTLDISFRK